VVNKREQLNSAEKEGWVKGINKMAQVLSMKIKTKGQKYYFYWMAGSLKMNIIISPIKHNEY